jgi:hypothetical protein
MRTTRNRMIEQDDNIKREMMLQVLRKSIVLNGEKFKVPAYVSLSAVHELECVLIYECKSTHGLTDEQIEEIKMNAMKRHDDELEKIKRKGDFI